MRADPRRRRMGACSRSTAFVLAPLIGTWAYQHLGPEVLWYSCGLVGLPLLAGFWLLARAWRPRAPCAGFTVLFLT